MDNKLNKIESKVDKIDERLDSVDKHLAVYNEQLKQHIKRTELLESEFVPIKSHVALMNSLAKIIIFLGILASLLKTIGIIK